MSPRRVIGMDAGGTKLLGGVVDEGLAVRDRVHRLWRGGGRRDVLDMIVDAVEEARAAAPLWSIATAARPASACTSRWAGCPFAT
jgi:glucokinase